jgi:hypothetical protein
MKIADYLGSHVLRMLGDSPFRTWLVERSFENDLEERIILYVFKEHGLELRCDQSDKISVIFLHSENYNGFDETLFEISFSCSREQVLKHFGTPSKSGEKRSDPILGDYGSWDRFTRPEYAVHIEYRTESNRIKTITLMRNDIVP